MRKLWYLVVVLALLSPPVLGAGGYGVVQTIGSGADVVTVLYAGGTPYDIGYWHGCLLRDQVQLGTAHTLAVARAEYGQAALLTAWDSLAPFVAQEFHDELQGLADGSGVPLSDLHELHALPDLSEFHCSAFNAFGAATANGHMLQMRILDYSMDLGIQDYPVVLVCEPLGGHRYANIAFAGFVGCIAGISSQGIGVSEMGDDFDYSFETLSGLPMPFLLRDVIAHATSFDQAYSMVQGADRTSSYWYVIGDAEAANAAVFQTSPVTFNTWGPGQMPAPYPALPSMCYVGHYMSRLYADLSANWGTLSPESAISVTRHNIIPGGNLLDAVYDLTSREIWVAYAEGAADAGTRPFVYLNTQEFQSPPYVLAVTPAEGAGADVDTVATACFSQALDPATVSPATFSLVGQAGGAVTGTVGYDGATCTATFTPGQALPQDAYTATLVGGAGGIKGANGAALLTDYRWTFTVTDTTAPSVSITSPAQGAVVKGVVSITAEAADNVAVTRVEFLDGGTLLGTCTAAPYQVTWDTRPAGVAEGAHQLRARAYDTAGNAAEAAVAVTVDNTTFDDVAKTASYWSAVEAVYREGIVEACSTAPPLYCPSGSISKANMAVYLCRAAGIAPYSKTTPTFKDVPKTMAQYPYIEAVYRAGIIGKCKGASTLYYCPSSLVTRDQMAEYLCRAKGTAQYKPSSPTFSDVSAKNSYYGWIEAAYRAGYVTPCAVNPLKYCPRSNLTRSDLAVWLCRTFGLPLQ